MRSITFVTLLFSGLLSLKTNGQNTFPTTGNAGIGTTTPGHKLSLFESNNALANFISIQTSTTPNSNFFIGNTNNSYGVPSQKNSNIIESYGDLHIGATNTGSIYFETARTGTVPPVRMMIDNVGNIGIGNTTPSVKLDMSGGAIRLNDPMSYPYGMNLNMTNAITGTWAREFSFSYNGTGKLLSIGTYASAGNLIYGYIGGATTAESPYNAPWMTFASNGNIGVNTTDTKGYKFAVNGSAVFTKVVVKSSASWPDYVFDSSYQLPSLETVLSFIQGNKHLPEMPSATAVEKDGHDVGEIQRLLLKKMEEMTLYMIEQANAIKELKSENRKLNAQMEELKTPQKNIQ